jgi:hypothetical protein
VELRRLRIEQAQRLRADTKLTNPEIAKKLPFPKNRGQKLQLDSTDPAEKGRVADSGVRTRVKPDGQVLVDWDPPKGQEMIIKSGMTVQVCPDGIWQIER